MLKTFYFFKLTNIIKDYIRKIYKVQVYRITIKFYQDKHGKWFFRGIKELYVIGQPGDNEECKKGLTGEMEFTQLFDH